MNRLFSLITVLSLILCLSGPAWAQTAADLGENFYACLELDPSVGGNPAISLKLSFNAASQNALTGATTFSVVGKFIKQVESQTRISLVNGVAAVVNDVFEVSLNANDVSLSSASSGYLVSTQIHLLVDQSSLAGDFTLAEETTGPDNEEAVTFGSGTVSSVSCY